MAARRKRRGRHGRGMPTAPSGTQRRNKRWTLGCVTQHPAARGRQDSHNLGPILKLISVGGQSRRVGSRSPNDTNKDHRANGRGHPISACLSVRQFSPVPKAIPFYGEREREKEREMEKKVARRSELLSLIGGGGADLSDIATQAADGADGRTTNTAGRGSGSGVDNAALRFHDVHGKIRSPTSAEMFLIK